MPLAQGVLGESMLKSRATDLLFFFLLEIESHYEVEVGLELVAIPLPLPSKC